jgi:hypothetical protein
VPGLHRHTVTDMREDHAHTRSRRPADPAAAPAGEPGEHDGSAALNWMVRYAVPLTGVIGAALYGVLRLAYVFFYLWLRATPDEVGYGYSQVLSDELIGAIELVVLIAVMISIVAMAASSLAQLARWTAGRYTSTAVQIHRITKAKAQKIAAWSLAIAVPVVLMGLPVLGWLEGAQAASGYAVRNVYLAGTIRLPVLAVQAVPAQVAWISTQGRDEVNISERQCLLYLGQASGISVFYDVHSQESLRLPSDDIVVSLQDTTTVPVGC